MGSIQAGLSAEISSLYLFERKDKQCSVGTMQLWSVAQKMDFWINGEHLHTEILFQGIYVQMLSFQ